MAGDLRKNASERQPSAEKRVRAWRNDGLAALVSTVLHVTIAGGLLFWAAQPLRKKPHVPVKVKIHEIKPPPPVQEEKKPEPPPPEKPKEKPKKKPPKRSSERPATKKPTETPPVPVQGLSPSALSPNGTGIAAPVGNSLMTGDDGKRHKAEDVKPLTDEDLTADATLIRSSVRTPQYSDAALDAELEGTYTVEVFVDASGAVTDAQLPKKIGYGMDDKVLAAARQARFTPRKDRTGRALEGWTEIKFRLEIPR